MTISLYHNNNSSNNKSLTLPDFSITIDVLKNGALFVSKLENFHDIINKLSFIKIYGSLIRTFLFKYNGVIRSFNVCPRLH